MRLRHKRPEDKSEADRQLIIAYKKTFGTEEGRLVYFDLLNKFYVLNGHGGDIHKEGQRSVALYIMGQSCTNLAEFDKLLKGELNG